MRIILNQHSKIKEPIAHSWGKVQKSNYPRWHRTILFGKNLRIEPGTFAARGTLDCRQEALLTLKKSGALSAFTT